jgi:hypothetical protein
MCQIIFLCLTTDNYIGISQAIATLLVGVATIFTYFRIARITERSLLFNKLNSDLDRIVEYTIQYPYFEDEEYAHKQYRIDIISSVEEKKNNALRYELFAIMNFNFVEDLYKYYNGNEKKMARVANFSELIESHAEYWKYRIIEKGEDGYKLITPLVSRVLKING